MIRQTFFNVDVLAQNMMENVINFFGFEMLLSTVFQQRAQCGKI